MSSRWQWQSAGTGTPGRRAAALGSQGTEPDSPVDSPDWEEGSLPGPEDCTEEVVCRSSVEAPRKTALVKCI